MNNLKRTLIINGIILAASVLMFAAASFAYFSDSKATTNTITAGNVSIGLSEAAVVKDGRGNLVEDVDSPRIFGSATKTEHDYGIVYPGQTIYKDPTIKNTGDEDAYVAAKITITDGQGDIHRIYGVPGYDEIDVTLLLSGGVLTDEDAHYGQWNGMENVTYNDHFAMIQVPKPAEGEYSFYIFFLKPMTSGEDVMLFDTVSFDPEFTGEEMKEFIDLKIDIWAFGTQTTAFTSCFEAMTEALPTHFADLIPNP